MKIKLRVLHTLQRWMKAAAPAAMLGMQLAVPTAQAQAGVFIDSNTYFTVRDVSLSSGTDAAYLQFGVALHNGSGGDVNMNDFGVKISDGAGHSYSAQLTSRQSARVTPGADATFRFSSQIPAQVADIGRLQVVVFRWDSSQDDLMNELGALPAADAATSAAVRQTTVQADEADASLPADAAVDFQAVRSFIVHQDEQAYLYTDVLATNTGSTSFSLPAGLKYRFVGTKTDSYSATIVAGTDTALLPGETRKVTVRAAIPSGLPRAADGYSLQFYSETSSGGVSVLGSVDVATVTTESVIGEAQPVFSRTGTKPLTVTITGAKVSLQTDGLHLSATVVVKNEGTEITALPALTGQYQFGGSGSAVSSSDTSSHPQYLAPQETSAYRFDAVLPSGLKPEDVRLALLASVTGSSSTKSGTTTSTTASSGSAASTASSSTSTAAATGGSTASAASTGAAVSTGGSAPIAVVLLKGAADGSDVFATAAEYKLGDSLKLAGSAFDADLDFKLSGFQVNPNEEDGFRQATAKFVITNNGKESIAMPSFQSVLTTSSGVDYAGTRQAAVVSTLMPGMSYVVQYAFTLPGTAPTEKLAMTIQGGSSAVAAANIALVPPKVDTNPLNDNMLLELYPFKVTLNKLEPTWTYNNGTFTYKLGVDAKVEKEDPNVAVDTNFSSLQFDLVDALGRVQATTTLPFTGANKIANGLQHVSWGSLTEINDPLSIYIYEVFTTPTGQAKRLLKVN
ncbi:hypothetical protein ACFFK0_00815 [Paenibacillus chartarius]|uniref:Uncharacterized protein n=1 Tax=Paenibacillus chartarius TaxID=747481 RepID=A0ABV6DED3_9BACL